MITVERTDNGWIVINDDVFRKKTVYVDRDEMLAAVYRAVCEWDVGDKVTVVKEAKEATT